MSNEQNSEEMEVNANDGFPPTSLLHLTDAFGTIVRLREQNEAALARVKALEAIIEQVAFKDVSKVPTAELGGVAADLKRKVEERREAKKRPLLKTIKIEVEDES